MADFPKQKPKQGDLIDSVNIPTTAIKKPVPPPQK
ncbi:hypothetical protein IX314_001456 [Fusobacterium sp. DD26]|nr:hypothetical protein [Fusobacterium sp. DD45]MBR8711437.1 hypothetical protein [Fusobacterium sp. DD28]MBR8751986.1 hypothetical protein [Fusobacterium sp. DD26]